MFQLQPLEIDNVESLQFGKFISLFFVFLLLNQVRTEIITMQEEGSFWLWFDSFSFLLNPLGRMFYRKFIMFFGELYLWVRMNYVQLSSSCTCFYQKFWESSHVTVVIFWEVRTYSCCSVLNFVVFCGKISSMIQQLDFYWRPSRS